MGWAWLVAAGAAEIVFAAFLKLSDGFTRLWPTVGFCVLAAISFYCMTRAMQTISLGTVYAVWTGIGAAGTAVVGIVWFDDPANFLRLFFLVMLIVALVGLMLVTPEA